MAAVIKIDLDKLYEMGIPLESYAIAATIHTVLKKPSTPEEIFSQIPIGSDDILPFIYLLVDRGLAEIGKKSGKVSVTPLWKERTKVQKEVKFTSPFVTAFRSIVEDMFPMYYWGAKDARFAIDLANKFAYSHEAKFGEPATDQQIVAAFKFTMINMAPFYKNKFQLATLDSCYNAIINEIRERFESERSKQSGIGSDFHRELVERAAGRQSGRGENINFDDDYDS